MVIQKRPASPLPKNFIPTGSLVVHKPITGQNWEIIANIYGLDPWSLIEFNFPTLRKVTNFQQKCAEVNWYMRENMGCSATNDQKNYSFRTTDNPGLVYIPLIPKPVRFKSYYVPKRLRRVRQPHNNVCWAASATIMMSWKEGKPYTIEEAMAKAGTKWLIRYKGRRGLPFVPVNLNYRFAAACGMNAAPFPCGDPDTWMALIKEKGPLAVAQFNSKDWDHLIVLYGVSFVNDSATMHAMDPDPGVPISRPFAEFMERYNDAFREGTKPSIWFYGTPFLPFCSPVE